MSTTTALGATIFSSNNVLPPTTSTESYTSAEFYSTEYTYPNASNSNETQFKSTSAYSDFVALLDIPYTIMELLVAVVAVIGNALVIIVFYRERRLRRRTNYYIISLAIADLLVGLLGVPFALMASVGLPKDLHACLFCVSLLVVLCTISIFCLVAVSIDRYWAILHPMAYSRNVRTKTAIGICLLCWLFGSIIGFLPLFGWHSGAKEGCLFVQIMDYNYLVFLYFTTIITPALLLAVSYGLIYRVIIKQMRHTVTMNLGKGHNKASSVKISSNDMLRSHRGSMASCSFTNISGTPGSNGSQGGTMLRMLSSAAQKREVKATQNLSIIVAFFMICWIPLYTINCIKAFCPECHIHDSLTVFGIVLSHSNSAVNPLLYAYHLKDFRGALLRLFRCKKQQEQHYRPSIISQQQQQQHMRQSLSRSFQPKIYVDSPVWRRAQMENQKTELKKAEEKAEKTSKLHKSISPRRKQQEPELSKITEASVSEYSVTERNSVGEPLPSNSNPNSNSQSKIQSSEQTPEIFQDGIDYDFLIKSNDKNDVLSSLYDTNLCDNCKFMKTNPDTGQIVTTLSSPDTTTTEFEQNISSQDYSIKSCCYANKENFNNIYLVNSSNNDSDNVESRDDNDIKCQNCRIIVKEPPSSQSAESSPGSENNKINFAALSSPGPSTKDFPIFKILQLEDEEYPSESDI